MDEEKEKPKTDAATNNDDGSEPKTTPLIERANATAKRLEEANQTMSENLDRQEEIYAKKALGGISEAGTEKEKPVEISNEEYANKVRNGEINPFKT